MAQTIVRIQSKLLREYYSDFSKYSKGKAPEKKVAWVTAFTPVEILEALDVKYYYPESYAAVIAASGKEEDCMCSSSEKGLSLDCCSYSACFNGCLDNEAAPRGIPPKPDILIATNNQCNTLVCWWGILAQKFEVPLIVLDYPGENDHTGDAAKYVTSQHLRLIEELEKLTGNRMDFGVLNKLIDNSEKSVKAWQRVISFFPTKDIKPTALFDDINFLITARCKEDTAIMYEMMADEMAAKEDAKEDRLPLYWLGYPLWYHPDRYLSECLSDFRMVGANYITWWNLNYEGKDAFEKLFNAYNFTFLNLRQESRDRRLGELIKASGARCAVVLHNKSCKCDFVSAKNVALPQVEIAIDMIDRSFLNVDRAREQLAVLRDIVCTE